MPITEEDLRKFALRPERPVALQSLANDPDNPGLYEGPPKFTSTEEAIEHFFREIIREDTFLEIMNLLSQDVPVMDVVQMMLTDAFENGLINPDLMMLLAEPLAYILIGLAEREGIKARIVTDPDDPEDPDDYDNWEFDDEELPRDIFREKLQGIKNPKADEELNLDSKIQNIPSLMNKGG